MKKFRYIGGVLAMLTSSLWHPAGAVAETEVSVPTFMRDVLPILQENCQDCHRSGGAVLGGMAAPMSFMTYEETRPWANVIKWSVLEGRMPPWHAAEQHAGQFYDERILTATEKQTLARWAETGTQMGNPADAPLPKEFPDSAGWVIGKPDLIVRMNEPYLVKDNITDEYINFTVEITEEMLPEPRWVKKAETRGGSAVVHHIIARPIGGISPGGQPRRNPDGFATLVTPGMRVVFQMHYNKIPGPGTAVWDQSEIGLIFYKEGEEIRHVVETIDMGMFLFSIPPGDPNYTYSTTHTFREDMLIMKFNPHMHLRGKRALYTATFPDGREQVLLDVPKYDFNWQHRYVFKEPIFAPAGTRVKLQLWWDNSASNPNNPDPTKRVYFGQPTTAEMGLGFMEAAKAAPRSIIAGEEIPEDLKPGSRGWWF